MQTHQFHARAQAAERRQQFETEARINRVREENQRARNTERRNRSYDQRSAFRLRYRNA